MFLARRFRLQRDDSVGLEMAGKSGAEVSLLMGNRLIAELIAGGGVITGAEKGEQDNHG